MVPFYLFIAKSEQWQPVNNVVEQTFDCLSWLKVKKIKELQKNFGKKSQKRNQHFKGIFI